MIKKQNLQDKARNIMKARGVLEVDALSQSHGVFDADGADVVVLGHVTAGAKLEKAASVVVRGDLIGDARNMCQIEASDEVIVFGQATYASIASQDICMGQGVTHCNLDAERQLEIGGDVSDTQIRVGNFDTVRRKLEELKTDIIQQRQDRETTQRLLRLEEKRMHNRIETTRISMDFSLGHMIVKKRKRITIDLTRFYSTLKDRSDELIDRALLEFYAKGVVGMLARVNMQFLQKGKNRQAIFKGVISKLKDLILATRKLDLQTQALQTIEKEHDALIQGLKQRTCQATVAGQILTTVVFQFVGVDFLTTEDGQVQLGRHLAKLEVGKEGVRETDINGISQNHIGEHLGQVILALQEEQIERVSLTEPKTSGVL